MDFFHLTAIDKLGGLELRLATRAEHLEWAKSHMSKIKMAGPVFADDGESFAGSIFVLDMPNLDAVRTWHASDPYVKAGLFERVEIRPFRWLIGAP